MVSTHYPLSKDLEAFPEGSPGSKRGCIEGGARPHLGIRRPGLGHGCVWDQSDERSSLGTYIWGAPLAWGWGLEGATAFFRGNHGRVRLSQTPHPRRRLPGWAG